jgi:hypothetical protein
MLRVLSSTFRSPKLGAADSEYEDASAVPGTELECASFRAAIADGATEAVASGDWSDRLARSYVELCWDHRKELLGHLPLLRDEWHSSVFREGLPWYVERKLQQGSFAALLGMKLCIDGPGIAHEGAWRAFVIGDCCLFHWRNNELLKSFPYESSRDFNNSPLLLSTNSGSWTSEVAHRKAIRGRWERGDTFVLATDAVAQWILAEYEHREDPWLLLRDLNDNVPGCTFYELLSKMRTEGRMRNDDATIVRIELA